MSVEGCSRNWTIAPGETIDEAAELWKVSDEELAEILGLTREELEGLFEGEYPIDNDLAVKLTRALGHSVQFWLNLERQYREDLKNGLKYMKY